MSSVQSHIMSHRRRDTSVESVPEDADRRWSFDFPTSSARHEPHPSRVEVQRNALDDSCLASSSHLSLLHPDCWRFVEPSYLQGSLYASSTSAVSFEHPCVRLFIDKLPIVEPTIAVPVNINTLFSRRFDAEAALSHSPRDVLGVELDTLTNEAVFTLAACYLLNRPRHRAHFTLWGGSAVVGTVRRVTQVMEKRPSPIIAHDPWRNIGHEIKELRLAHHRLLGVEYAAEPTPNPPQVSEGRVTRSVTKKRKAPLLTRKKSTRHSARKELPSAATAEDGSEAEVVEIEIVEPSEDEDEDERPAKRAKTGTNADTAEREASADVLVYPRPGGYWRSVFRAIAAKEQQTQEHLPSQASSRTVSVEASPVLATSSLGCLSKSKRGATKIAEQASDRESSAATCVEDVPASAAPAVRRSSRDRKATVKVISGSAANKETRAKTVAKKTAQDMTSALTKTKVPTRVSTRASSPRKPKFRTNA